MYSAIKVGECYLMRDGRMVALISAVLPSVQGNEGTPRYTARELNGGLPDLTVLETDLVRRLKKYEVAEQFFRDGWKPLDVSAYLLDLGVHFNESTLVSLKYGFDRHGTCIPTTKEKEPIRKGVDKLQQVNRLIESLGGIPKTIQTLDLIESFGGLNAAKRFIELLR